MDNGVRNFEQVSIFGKLPKREITLYVGVGGEGQVLDLRKFRSWNRNAENNRLDYGI